MTTVLVTGFGPFAQHTENPSAQAVAELAARWSRPDGAELVTAVLPVSFSRATTELGDLIALHRPAVIVVQDRELPNLTEEDRRAVRVLQRGYVTLWVDALQELAPARDVAELTLRAQAAFGLINSTPHSLRRAHRLRAPQDAERLDAARAALEEMTWAALRTAFAPTPTSTGGTP